LIFRDGGRPLDRISKFDADATLSGEGTDPADQSTRKSPQNGRKLKFKRRRDSPAMRSFVGACAYLGISDFAWGA
jgi:hypothetical protein